MAFKLVGDQVGAIRQERKKRVTDLLLSEIPDNETLKMRDGRFACLICGHRPVFDTMMMLSIHRSGKRHIQAYTKRVRTQEMQNIALIRNTDKEKGLPPLLVKAQLVKQESLNVSDDVLSVTSDGGGLCDSDSNNKVIGAKRNNSFLEAKQTIEKAEFVFPWKVKQTSKKPKLTKSKKQLEQNETNTVSLRSSGWIPHGDGTWSKDPAVEFDSDEEPEPVQ